MSNLRQIRQSQQGMVSFMVTIILMLVISLVVVGFAQIARRNQRQALDRQLSTQAFYAAESGINDATNLIQASVVAGNTIQPKTDCTGAGPSGFYGSLNPTIDSARNVSYSCLLVNPSPPTLQYTTSKKSTIIPISSADGSNFRTLKLSWKTTVNTATPITGCPTSTTNIFSPTGSWSCSYGVLRFDLVPTSGNSLDASSLAAATMTSFAVPLSSGGTNSISYAPGSSNANNVVGVACNNTSCDLTIDGLSKDSYYMRVSSIYQDSSLQITGAQASGAAINFSGAQVLVDATGKAQDILRRVQVRVPVHGDSKNALPDFAMQSTDSICKRFAVMSGYFQSSAGLGGSNPLCQ